MSRLTTMSPAALRALFSPEADDTLMVLLTFTGTNIPSPIRISDNFTTRISETADEVLYGTVSRGNNFIFMPVNLTLPTETDSGAPRAQLTIHDCTRYLLPQVRQLNTAVNVLIELVLFSTPDTVEASFVGFKLSNVSYDADAITGELSIESFDTEPFPAHTFTPANFPGLF